MATEHEIAQAKIIGIAAAIAHRWKRGDEASEYDRTKLIEAVDAYYGDITDSQGGAS